MSMIKIPSLSQMTALSVSDVIRALDSSLSGLTQSEASERQKLFGSNSMPSYERGLFRLFLQKLNDPFVYLLFIAASLSFVIGEKMNGMLLLIFILINALFGFFQEARAHKALKYLKKKLAATCSVKRDGKLITIDKSQLVPGDIVFLEGGAIVPADMRIVEDYNLIVDESILTGESVDIAKTSDALAKGATDIFDMKNMLFAGSHVMGGDGYSVVVAIGAHTQMGAIAQVVANVRPTSNYLKQVKQFSKMIALTALISIPLIMIGHYWVNKTASVGDLIIFAIALIVGIIPETFPTLITFALATAALRLAEHKIIVKRLLSIEDLGDIEILCTDKTGTLTENKMVLEQIVSDDADALLLYGFLSATKPFDPITISSSDEKKQRSLDLMRSTDVSTGFDTAIAEKMTPELLEKADGFVRESEIPFDSDRIRNTVSVRDSSGNELLIVRGAPELILELSAQISQPKEEIKKQFEQLGRQGRRILAIATKKITTKKISIDDEKDLTFVGFFSFIDPVKKSARETIASAQKFGLRLKILTGDTPEVAAFVAQEIGLVSSKDQVVNARDLAGMAQEDFQAACEKYVVFARITPIMKLNVVNALQKKYSVGFLGDGINDTPALKAAHVGIAVQEAVDVAREAADIIVLEKSLSIIIFAIKEGRRIFANINTYVKTTMSNNLGNYYSLGILSLLLPYLPILPIQILLVNILSDMPLLAISTDNVLSQDLREPKRYQFNKDFLLIVLLAVIGSLPDISIFALYRAAPESVARTLWFIVNIVTEIGLIFIVRNRRFFFSKPYPSLALIVASCVVTSVSLALPFTTLGQQYFYFVIPTIAQLITIVGILIVFLALSEIVMLVYYRKQNALEDMQK